MNTARQIEAFLADATGRAYARLPTTHSQVKARRVTQIRSKLNPADAFVIDELGNAFVLFTDGRRSQLFADELRGAGVYR